MQRSALSATKNGFQTKENRLHKLRITNRSDINSAVLKKLLLWYIEEPMRGHGTIGIASTDHTVMYSMNTRRLVWRQV